MHYSVQNLFNGGKRKTLLDSEKRCGQTNDISGIYNNKQAGDKEMRVSGKYGIKEDKPQRKVFFSF